MNEVTVGTAHQYKIRVEKEKEEILDFNIEDVNLKNTSFEVIDKQTAKEIVVKYEWLKTIPHQTSHHFGLYFNINNKKYLGGVLIFSQDYAQNTGVWDKYGFGDKLILLSRGVSLWWTPKNTASFFITKAIKWLKENTHYRIITATVDPSAGEIGTIYQALNWKYVGLMNGNYSGSGREKKRFSVLINGKLRYSRSIRKEFGCMRKDVILEKYPYAKFIEQYRKRRYFHFFDTKENNKIYKDNISHLLLPYPKRGEKPISGIIYKITNVINNKVYIGQTVRALPERITEYRIGQGNDYLNNSIKKYGFENFKFEIIQTCNSIDELNKCEIKYINEYNSRNRDVGYNIAYGGGNSLICDETRKKMSETGKGRKQSKEWVAKRILPKGSDEAKKYGRPKTKEEKEYLSKNSPKYWEGKKRSQETINKIKETRLKRGFTIKEIEARKKQSKIVCKERDGVIIEYESMSEAGRQNNISSSAISKYANNNRTVDGWYWFIKEKKDD